MKKAAIRFLATLFLAGIALCAQAQNCDVNFPGTANVLFSASCGATPNNVVLGRPTEMGNGDVLTFDQNVTISGNVTLNADGNGKIIIPAGVTVIIDGNTQFDSKNGNCRPGTPCMFEIVVNGTLIFSHNFKNDVNILVWSGTGTVTFDDKFDNSNIGCMQCGVGGCPTIDADDCKDSGVGCASGDFCATIVACSNDTTKPTISGCPSNRTVNITGAGCTQPVSWTAPTAADNCSVKTFTSSHSPGFAFPKGSTTVTYTAKDPVGNTTTCSFIVTVNDITPPVISGCPANITVNAGASCDAVVNWTAPTFTDNCTGGTLASTKAPGSSFPKGATTVTYTATDASGNTATCSFIVTVNDITPPVISGCPANITVNASASCNAVVNWTAPTFTDNCTGGTLASTKSPGSTFPIGPTTVVYTATDAAGNTATCSFIVTVNDITPPVISGCPANIIVNANASCNAVVNWTAPTLTDNCTGATLASSKSPGSTFPIGPTTVVYTATDAAGNTSTCSFIVTVNDVTPPVISGCPANITVNASASCNAVVNWTAPTFADNCTGATIASTKTPGSTFLVGPTTVIYTATDAAGNTSTCSFIVTVNDITPPVISGCPANITVNASASCNAVVNWTAPTFTDNCTGGTLASTKAPGSTFPKGPTTVTYTATDAAGNTSTCSFIVTVNDITPPVISGCPANITVNASASCNAVVNWTAPTLTDNCTGATLASTKSPGSTFAVGPTTVTYTATDAAGNTATCSFIVTVKDITPPVISGCPANITVNASASCNAVVNWTAPTFTDNCTGATLASTKSPGSTFPVGATTVTYTATDLAGNASTCSFIVTVNDVTPPAISGCPANITVNASACNAVVNWTAPTFTDNCTGATIASTKTPGSTFLVGPTTVIYTATDAAGNTSTCSFIVTVNDVTPPVISGCPANITVNASASCNAVVTWTAPTFTDNCTGATLASTKSPGSTFAVGPTTVTYTATDVAGNTSTCSFIVTVKDITPPVISGCPANITVNANASCNAVASWTVPTFTDNCTGATLSSNKNPGSTFPLGPTTVTYIARDAAGNTSTCSFIVTVKDVTPPVISGCPSNITMNTSASCDAVVSWTAPTFTDNCTGSTLASTKSPGSTFAVGPTTVTYTATDAAGNTSTCSFIVTVKDITPPVISGCPSNITVNASASCDAVVNWTAPTAGDNCSLASFTPSHSPGSTFPKGSTTVIYTAKDPAGNTSTCSFIVTVNDITPPVISGCPANITVNAAACSAVVNWTAPTFTDNCTGATLASTKPSGSTFPVGPTTVTYTATDAAGNKSTCSFVVTVNDITPPVINGCQANITVNANASCNAVVSWTALTCTDNCGGATLTSSKPSGSTFPIGPTTVIYTATDAAGNTATCSFIVTVKDVTPPVISGCPANITVNATGSCDAVANWTVPTFADNCTGATLSSTKTPGSTFPIGLTTVTYTATDVAGNTSTCSFTVTVIDVTPPVINGCPADITASSNSTCDAVVNWTAPTFADNCTGGTLVSTKPPGSTFAVGSSTTITYTATDAAGNTATCSFTVTVIDKTSPVFSNCPVEVKATANPQSCDAIVTWTPPTAIDNCGGIVTFSSTHTPGSTFPVGHTIVRYTATDPVGNTAQCEFTVMVANESAPVISSCPEDIAIRAGESGETAATWTEPTASVACGEVMLEATHRPGDSFPVGETEVVYTAVAPDGKNTTCKFTVTVAADIQFGITQVVTPNGDGINDHWELKDIQNFERNNVTVVDRWGNVVYKASGYNNDSVVWKGENTQGTVVPTGTYFYTISVDFRSSKVEKRGFVEVVR